ncbi:SAV_2336 N-terminal domain-related protein [Streptomyces sp. NBC_01408]|uniref:SAV_2336 N-terminal domain-related protein n=1 Tax=Streptomyces sp. NBC_01408 TaxID=2903855 RepID=UPI002254370B|nr:SAV_2336 N-terminal domain-related protein [Streptomyces sp. NBC_01408]MCX4691045.1 SAV_2336 N-terminal domain-related protein [Streptomyces sp. NBC_01408]
MPIRELAALLRAAGIDPTAEELADALWLAGKIHGPGPTASGPFAAGTDEPGQETEADGPVSLPAEPVGGEPGPEPEAEDPVRLYAAGARRTAAAEGELPEDPGVPVRVPRAAALPRILDIQRALRALQRHRPPVPPARTVLDEAATAEASARAFGTVIPVFRPDTRREATARLVMDASPSMAVWHDMFEELRSVCERLGAFRDVRVHYLHRLADGTPVLGRCPVAAPGLRSGDQLRDPTGRALTMLVSDCTGPLWREGQAQRLLYRWAECTPCMVVQPLPQRLWGRSWLPTERGTLTRIEGGGGKLKFRSDRPPRSGRPTGGLAVPVLPPGATALGAWARLVAGIGTGPVPAEVGRVLAAHPAAPAPPPAAVRPPLELVRRFRSSAAPRAVQLAVYLSAAPLTLPVMRLVQRTMLPDSEPSDLAEVLLSGMLRRSGPEPGQWYEFVPGVQDVLLGPLGRDEAALVLKHCSEYVQAHFGRGVRNFPALAVSQLTGAPVAADPGGQAGDGPQDAAERVPAGPLPQAFAQVSAKVVRRYLPDVPGLPGPTRSEGPAVREPVAAAPAPGRAWAVRTARERLADADADTDTRALYEAVAVLRRAVAAPAGADDPPEEAETELARALLRLWAAERDPDLLAEAERAVTGLRTAAARLVRGRVLYERALAAEPDAELLAAADREFAAAGALPDPDGGALRRDCAVRRAQTLIRLSELRDDPGALREARAALEPLAGPAPDPDPDPGAPGPGAPVATPGSDARPGPELHLALGRVLLALLPRTPDPAERTELAGQAAARLAVDPAAPREERARVRVERATALRHLPDRLEEASGQLATALEEAAGDPELRVAALLGVARVRRARYERDGDPVDLEGAAEAYGRARRLIPRDAEAFGELLPEWGDVLLDRARAADGRSFTGAAVRVLRESRAAVPQSDPRAAHRLARLATGLRMRHAYEGDVVDLREAEYLLELAVRQSRSPLEQARAWRDHGDVQREIHGHTRAADRLDRAADSYRRAWRAALEADREEGGEVAVELAARVQELRGEVLERLARPRAALDAYRSALELWARLGAGAEGRYEALRARVRALEAGP